MKNEIRTAELLCVGTELLLGDIVNTNAAYLARRLAALGIFVYREATVGDNEERLLRAFSDGIEKSDLLLVTGGLGPTCDDITRETLARLFDAPLEYREDIADGIRKYFASTGRKMTDNNLRQAMVPRGAEVIPNDCGTAPGILFEKGGKTVILMPGVPREMINMFETKVVPYLSSRRSHVLVSRNLNIFGIGESAAEDILRPLMERANPSVAPYAKEGEMRIRITAAADDTQAAELMCREVESEIRKTEVGKFIYGVDVPSIEHALADALREKKLTFACVESCTGGLIAKRMVDLAGVSDVFVGGFVTYANEAKERLVGVKHETLEKYGAVSEESAAEMARGARERLSCDVAVSVTGVAGPGGGTPEKPVGTVYIGLSTKDGERVKRLSLSPMRDRNYLRYVSASNALHFALTEISK